VRAFRPSTEAFVFPYSAVPAHHRAWERVCQAILARMQRRHAIDWERWCVDGTSIRALHAAAGARKKGGPAREPADHALGRSRGGWGSKLHLTCDARGTITAFRLTAGQMQACTAVVPLLESVCIGRRRRRRHLAGDRAYATVAVRQWGRTHRVRLSIPERVDHIRHRRRFGLADPAFDRAAYRARNIIERAVGWLKQARPLATRAEKLAVHYRALVALALSVRYAGRYLSDST
jgi:transposase